MPRPTLPDNVTGVLVELDRRTGFSANGVALVEVGDATPPNNITGLGLSSQVSKDRNGRDTATVTAVWDPIQRTPTEDVDERKAQVRDYQVTYSLDGESSFSGGAFTELNSYRIDALPVGRIVTVRVRARTFSGTFGPFAEAQITTAHDTVPPDKPTAPVLEASGFLKAVQVRWDGRLGTAPAGQFPSDFTHLEIWVSKLNPPSSDPNGLIGTMDKSERTYTFPTRDYEPVRAQFRSVDRSGNKSAFSDVSNAMKGEQAVSEDLAESVKVNARAQGTFGGGNGVDNSSFEAKTEQGGANPFHAWARFGTTGVGSGRGFHNDRFVTITRSGGSVSYLQSSPIPISEAGPKVVSAWVRLNQAGLTPRVDLYNPAGTQPTVAPDAEQHPEYRLDNTKTGVWQRIAVQYSSSVVGPSDGSQDHVVRVLMDSGLDGTVDVDAVQYELGTYVSAYAPQPDELTPGSIGKTQIRDDSISSEKIIAGSVVAGKIQADAIGANEIRAGSITASKAHLEDAVVLRAKIRDLAVDNARIADATITTLKVAEMSAERISTGTLRAGTRIIAGNPGGNRVEIDGDGVRLITTRFGYNETTVGLDVATGTGRFVGEISGSTIRGGRFTTSPNGSGARIEMLDGSGDRDMIRYFGPNGGIVGEVRGLSREVHGINGTHLNSDYVRLGHTHGSTQFYSHESANNLHDQCRIGLVQAASSVSGTVVIPFEHHSRNPFNGYAPQEVYANIRFSGDPGTSGPGNGAAFVNTGDFSQAGFRLYVMRGSDGQPVSTTRVFYFQAKHFGPTP